MSRKITYSDEQVSAIKAIYGAGIFSAETTARLFNCSTINVYKYASGERRSNVEVSSLDDAKATLMAVLDDQFEKVIRQECSQHSSCSDLSNELQVLSCS